MMVISKKKLSLSLVFSILAAGICFIALRGPAKSTDGGEVPEIPAGGEAPIPVKAVSVVRRDLVMRLTSPGEVFARKRAVIKTDVAGALEEVAAEEGRPVRAGDVLARIDNRVYVLRWEGAEAERLKRFSEMLVENEFGGVAKQVDAALDEKIRNSEAALDASASRYAAGEINPEEYAQIGKAHETLLIEAGRKKSEVQAASKGLTQAEVEVAVARLDLERTKVRAPFSGVLTGVKVSLGETVSPGQDLMTLVDVRDVRVDTRVLESEIGRMRPGRQADIRFIAYPGKVFKGRVQAVSPVVDPTDTTCAVHVAIDNAAGDLKPGMHAEVAVDAEIYEGRLLVPHEAVLVRGGRKLVFAVENGQAKWRYIETGLENERYVEILKGVSEGELVIVDGHLTLAHDARVTLAE